VVKRKRRTRAHINTSFHNKERGHIAPIQMVINTLEAVKPPHHVAPIRQRNHSSLVVLCARERQVYKQSISKFKSPTSRVKRTASHHRRRKTYRVKTATGSGKLTRVPRGVVIRVVRSRRTGSPSSHKMLRDTVMRARHPRP